MRKDITKQLSVMEVQGNAGVLINMEMRLPAQENKAPLVVVSNDQDNTKINIVVSPEIAVRSVMITKSDNTGNIISRVPNVPMFTI